MCKYAKIVFVVSLYKANKEEALKYNPSAVKSVSIPQKRQAFMNSINKKGFIKTINKFFGGSFIIKLKRLVRKVIK